MNLGANVNCYRCIFWILTALIRLSVVQSLSAHCFLWVKVNNCFCCSFFLLFRVLILISKQKLLPRRMRNIKIFLLFVSSSHHKYYVYVRSLNKLPLSFLLLCAFNFIKIIKITFPRAFETHSLACVSRLRLGFILLEEHFDVASRKTQLSSL